MITRKKVLTAITAGAMLSSTLVMPQAMALTASTSFVVTATVLQACIVTASPLVFGNYDPTASTATDASTSVLVTCTNGTAYNVGLNQGGGSGATVATRKMTSGGNTMSYSLYQDAGRSSLWGNTVGSDTVAGTATGLPVTHNVYGRIPAQQSVHQGAYSDTITVTVTY